VWGLLFTHGNVRPENQNGVMGCSPTLIMVATQARLVNKRAMETQNKTRFQIDNPILKKREVIVFAWATLSGISPLERLFSIKPKAPI